MISFRCFQILTVLRLVLSLLRTYQHQAFTSCVQATDVGKVLERRAIGSSYESVEDVAKAPTETVGRVHDEHNDTEQIYRAESSERITKDHDGQGSTPAITKGKLPRKRKAEISEKLASHQKEIEEMRTEWQGITTLFEFLEENKENLGMHIKPDLGKTIDDIMEELRIYYRYVFHLVQNRLRELGGLGGIVIGMKIQKKEEGSIQQGLGAEQVNLSKDELKKQDQKLEVPKEKIENPQATKVLGHSALHVVLKENIQAQKEFLEEPEKFAWKDPTHEQDGRDLNFDPSEFISHHLKAERLQDLNSILHSFAFSSALEFVFFSERELRRVTKTSFETFIFKVLQFMYKFEIINQEGLKSFFSSTETQEVAAVHLTDLFNVYWGGFWGQQTNLLPDMSLIRRHWHTQHLHVTLGEIDENQLKSITYKTLTETLKAFSWAEDFYVMFQPRVRGLFSDENFLSRLENWELFSKTDPNYKDVELRDYLKVITEFFQNPIPTPSGPSHPHSLRIDYLLTYCVLKFLNDHHPKVLEDSFNSGPEYEIFKTQFSLLQAGLHFHQQANQVLDYELLLRDEYLIMNHIPKTIAEVRKDSMKEELEDLESKYLDILKKVSELAETNLLVKDWMENTAVSKYIISFLTGKALSLKIKPELIERLTPEYKNSFLI